MPAHDWTKVDAGIFHHFHYEWISEIARALNAGRLPEDYYALAEQHAAGFGPDVLALQEREESEPVYASRETPRAFGPETTALLAPPKTQPVAEALMDFRRRRQNSIGVRHVSDDRVVAMIEIVSPGNKSSRHGLRAFVEKAAELLEKGIHLLILDVHPPGKRDPFGMHEAIWSEISGEESAELPMKPLIMASYESSASVRAFVECVGVGDDLPDMPLFLKPDRCIQTPLDASYQAAFAAMPQRWRRVLEA